MKKSEPGIGEEKRLDAYSAAAVAVLALPPAKDTTVISGWVDKEVINSSYKIDIEGFGFIFEEYGYLGIIFPGSGYSDYGWMHNDRALKGYGSVHIQDWSSENNGDVIRDGDKGTVSEPPTLALLAMGAAGVDRLRRRCSGKGF